MKTKNAHELVRRVQTGALDARDFLIIQLQTPGSDPSLLFEILEDIVRHQRWQEILGENGRPLGSLRRLLEAPQPSGCGVPAEKVLKLLDIEHRYEQSNQEWRERMAILREQVRLLLQNEGESSTYDLRLPPLMNRQEAGRRRWGGRRTVDISTPSAQGGNSRDYTLARLKRDRPDLAEKVIAGQMSANAAAIEAGFRSRKYAIRLDNLELTIETLRRLLPPEDRMRLAQMLLDDTD